MEIDTTLEKDDLRKNVTELVTRIFEEMEFVSSAQFFAVIFIY